MFTYERMIISACIPLHLIRLKKEFETTFFSIFIRALNESFIYSFHI